MNKSFLIVVAAIMIAINAVIYLSSEAATLPGHCSLKITSPEMGAAVDLGGVATGIATIPEGAHLWLFIKARPHDRWWPQGEAIVAGNAWKLDVRFGNERREEDEFYLAAAALPERAHAHLAEWASVKLEDRRRPASRFPEVVAGCPLDIVAVRRPK